jgi:quercetin dioxygenase-like cupin family protein
MADKLTQLNDLTKVFYIKDLVGYQDHSVVSREIIRKPSGTMTVFAFDEEEGLSEHTAPFDAAVYILEGEAEIRIDGKPFVVNEGEMIIMPAGKPHALKAITRYKMLLVMIK